MGGRSACESNGLYRSRAPNNVRRLPIAPIGGIGLGGGGRKPDHGLSSRTTCGKPQFRRLGESRRTEEAHLVHAGCAAWLSAPVPEFPRPPPTPRLGGRWL